MSPTAPTPSAETDAIRGAPAYVKAIAPYQGGRPIEEVARAYGLDPARFIKLASNENPLGMPESARRAAADALADVGRYPDGNAHDMTRSAEKFARQLAQALKLPVAMVDERYTSKEAEALGAKDVDSMAACLSLERYFAALTPPIFV